MGCLILGVLFRDGKGVKQNIEIAYVEARRESARTNKSDEIGLKDKNWWIKGKLPDYECSLRTTNKIRYRIHILIRKQRAHNPNNLSIRLLWFKDYIWHKADCYKKINGSASLIVIPKAVYLITAP